MNGISFLTRGLVVAAAVMAGTAAAQAPANDACAGAEVLALNGATPVTSTTATGFDLAAAAVEQAMSCTSSVKNSVWYTFTPTVTGMYTVETCGSVTNFDTVLAVYSGTCAALTAVTGGCNDTGGCGSAGASSVTVALTAGTPYFAQVAVWSSVTLSASLTSNLTVRLLLPPANDTCDGTIPSLSVDRPLPFSTNRATNNDSEVGGGLACYVGLGNVTTSTIAAAPGRDVVFSFTPPATGAYSLRLSSSASVNAILYLTDSCTAAMTPPQVYAPPQCIAAVNRYGSSSSIPEDLTCIPLTAGVQRFVWADEGALSTSGSDYELEVNACSLEVEPNDTPAAAAPTACPVTGSIGTAGDVDFFSLGTNPAGSRVFAMVDGQASANAGTAATDYDLRVTTATDTLEVDTTDSDTLFGTSSGSVAGTPLPAAPAYLRINYSSAVAREPYRLYSVVQTGTPTAEIEPNDTPTTANGGAANYFSGDVSSTTDVDLYAFVARAGQLVYLSLDSQPSRTGSSSDGGVSTGNHTLQLLDRAVEVPTDGGPSTSAALIAVNDSNTTVNNVPTTGSLTATTPVVPSEALVYRIRADGTYFARVGRTSSTGTGAYLLSIALDCGAGGGIGAPNLVSLTPDNGTISGGTSVTLSGSNFSSLATVRIGGAPAAIVSRTATSLTVLTPAGSEGAADVTVINPGNQPSTLTGAFTYIAPIAPPTLSSVTPPTGPTAGGTVITVNGTLFKAGALVRLTVGGVSQPATNVVIVNSTQLRATTPAHAPGLATVTVRNPVDALEGSADLFTYLAPPTVTSITPNTGSTAGGETVTLQGTAFRPDATVRFGANAGTGVTVAADGLSLTVVTPSALVSGPVDVTVINTDTQQTVVTQGFTYRYPAPTITSITPASGFAAGGTTITITGTGFQLRPTVTVGGAPATNVNRTSLTSLTAITPAGTPGPADVVVTNTDAQSVTRTGGFHYVAAPVVSAVAPNHGPAQGGTVITLTGTDFQPGATVRLGGVPAFAVNVTSPTTATAVTNAHPAGAVDVTLTNPDTQSHTLAMGFTYDGAPALTALSPVSGSTAGGTVVTLTGSGFLPGASVLFGADAATGVTVVSPTELTAVTPAHALDVVSVTVRNPDNQLATLVRAYRFVAPPSVTSLDPNTGDVAGGTVVRITGAGFSATSTVSFGGVLATQVSPVSATELDAVTPAHLPGAVDVVVDSNGASATLTGGFTYTRGAPTLTAVAPSSGPMAGGTVVTLTGTGFAPGATVTVGGSAATDVVVVSSVLARAVVPAHAEGRVDVVLANDDAQAATLANGFTYVAPPSNTAGTVTDGGTGGLGTEPTGGGGGAGGVSCGCSSFDGSMFSMAGFGLMLVLSRRRRRS